MGLGLCWEGFLRALHGLSFRSGGMLRVSDFGGISCDVCGIDVYALFQNLAELC